VWLWQVGRRGVEELDGGGMEREEQRAAKCFGGNQRMYGLKSS
jgi:hypothetical protein